MAGKGELKMNEITPDYIEKMTRILHSCQDAVDTIVLGAEAEVQAESVGPIVVLEDALFDTLTDDQKAIYEQLEGLKVEMWHDVAIKTFTAGHLAASLATTPLLLHQQLSAGLYHLPFPRRAGTNGHVG